MLSQLGSENRRFDQTFNFRAPLATHALPRYRSGPNLTLWSRPTVYAYVSSPYYLSTKPLLCSYNLEFRAGLFAVAWLEALSRRAPVHREVALVARVALEWRRRRNVVVLGGELLSPGHVPLRVVR